LNIHNRTLFGILAALAISAGCEKAPPPAAPATPSQTQSAPASYPTLPPSNFSGRAREAYQAALDVPEVLKEVQCYCGCAQNEGHKNNLHCFMDLHGVG
jgi:hypothetical protein